MKAQLTATKTPLLAALVAAGAMIGASVAHAVPTITISSPGDIDIVVGDGGIGDDDGVADGKIEFSESISSFNFVGSTAFTKPFLGTDALQIDTAFTAVSLGAGDVTITFSETDFDVTGSPTFISTIGGTTEGAVTYTTFVDDSNAINGMATQVGDVTPLVGPLGNFSGADTGTATVSTPFSMTQVINISHTGTGITDITTGNANLRVPVPATLGLLGVGLLGLGWLGRRRTASA